MEQIVLDPPEVAAGRSDLDLTPWISSEGPDWSDAAVVQYLADAERGEIPVDFRVANRQITIPLRIKQANGVGFDEARRRIQAKAALFQRRGGWLKRTLSNGQSYYLDITNAALKLSGGWMQAHRDVDTDASLVLDAIPDFYGDEIALDAFTETTAAALVTVLKEGGVAAVIKGDYPGRCRIQVDELDNDAQLGLIAALRSRHHSAAVTAKMHYEAEALTPLDVAAIATLTGASGGGTNNAVTHNNLGTDWTSVLSTDIAGVGAMTHTGTNVIWVRVHTTSPTPPELRLVYDVGDLTLPEELSPVSIPAATNIYLIPLGQVRLDESPVGPHRWKGVIQARGPVGGENVTIDLVEIVNADEFYSVLRAPINADPGLVAYSARDEFNQPAGTLAAKTLPVGGTWAEAGATGAFSVETTGKTAQRTATADSGYHFGLAGTNVYAAIAVQADVKAAGTAGFIAHTGVFARYVDTSNYLIAIVVWAIPTSGSPSGQVKVIKFVGGSAVDLAPPVDVAISQGQSYALRLLVDGAGRWAVWRALPGGQPGDALAFGQHADLATGGTLDDGRVGIVDQSVNATAATRNYDNFKAWVPPADAVIHPNQSAELRTDGMFREDAAGAAYGKVPHVVDALPRIPPSGLEGRPVELFLKGSRGDFELLPDSSSGDDIRGQVFYRPSWLSVPSV